MAKNIPKWPKNIPNGLNKYIRIVHLKVLQNIPKLKIFGMKKIPSGNPGFYVREQIEVAGADSFLKARKSNFVSKCFRLLS
jgi:hypothetical protein